MATVDQRGKGRTGRGKATAAPTAPSAPAAPAPDPPSALVDAVFSALPEAPSGDGVPEVVRANRRTRAKRRLVDALEARGPYPVPEARLAEVRRFAWRWAQKAFAADFAEADDFELRCADERVVLDAAARGDEPGRFSAAERSYRREVERRHGWIEIRGLQLSARVYQDLEIAFVPLHVEELSEAPPPPKKAGKRKGNKKEPDAAPEADVEALLAMVRALERPRVPAIRALARHPRLLVVGGPGSGKSTLVAFLATRSAREQEEGEAGWLKAAIPFVLPVRALPPGAVTREALAGMAGAEAWFFAGALGAGRALLLVDGLDEARPERAAELVSVVSGLVEAHPGTRVVATTRPVSGAEDGAAPGGFAAVRLTPMTRAEVYGYVDRWCLAAELSLGKAREQAEIDARAAADDLKERVRLRSAIERLAQTPLLCAVICIVHRFLGERIPERRVVLYEAITNALLYEWDRAKFPEKAVIGQLDAQQKRALLAKLAREMHEARVVEWPEASVIAGFAALLPALGRRAEEAAAIVAEIRDRNGVLVERSPGMFGFSHLTFQEYLTAMEVVRRREYERLLKGSGDEWWHEVIVLAAGFPGADAAGLVRGLLDRDGGEVAEGTLLAASCVETAVEIPPPVREQIDRRIASLIPPKDDDEVRRLARIGPLVGPALLKKLESADPEGQAAIVRVLGFVPHEPAVGALRRLLKDDTRVSGTYRSELPMAYIAASTLLTMAAHSDAALGALVEESRSPDSVVPHDVLAELVKQVLSQRLGQGGAERPPPSRRSAARSG